MAPEMLNGLPYNEKVDVFSFGMIVCEVNKHAVSLQYGNDRPWGKQKRRVALIQEFVSYVYLYAVSQKTGSFFIWA